MTDNIFKRMPKHLLAPMPPQARIEGIVLPEPQKNKLSTDRELLQEMFDFMVKRNYVQGDESSIRDMVLRYKQPPLTLYHRVCMQMTVEDYDKLTKLLGRVVAHFNPDNVGEEIANEPA